MSLNLGQISRTHGYLTSRAPCRGYPSQGSLGSRALGREQERNEGGNGQNAEPSGVSIVAL